MDATDTANFEVMDWQQARESVAQLRPNLAKIIDTISPDKSFKLYKARYKYGEPIMQNGQFYLPEENGESLRISDERVDKSIREALDYNGTLPAGMVLGRSMELFIEQGELSIPFLLMPEGHFFALWRTLDPMKTYHAKSIWNATAGARTIFMLPKISDAISHRKLQREFNVKLPRPKRLLDHFPIFKSLANNRHFESAWKCELLFFSKPWFERSDDPAWMSFYYYLYEKIWRASDYHRNQFIWNFIFSYTQSMRNLKPNPYIADTAKHLFATGLGVAPGFSFLDDDALAPMKRLQQIYTDVYNLKSYAPTLMGLHYFERQHKPSRPVYYSLQLPTALEFSPKSRRLSSTMEELREIRHVMDIYISEILSRRLNIEDTPLYDLAKTVDFEYFHSEEDRYQEIATTQQLLETDPHLQQQLNKFEGRSFAETGHFIRGCVRVVGKQ